MICWPCKFTVLGIYCGEVSEPSDFCDQCQEPSKVLTAQTGKQQSSVQVPTCVKTTNPEGLKSASAPASAKQDKPRSEAPSVIEGSTTPTAKREDQEANGKSLQHSSSSSSSSSSEHSLSSTSSSSSSSSDSTQFVETSKSDDGTVHSVGKSTKSKPISATAKKSKLPTAMKSPGTHKVAKPSANAKTASLAPAKKVRFATKIQERVIPQNESDSSSSDSSAHSDLNEYSTKRLCSRSTRPSNGRTFGKKGKKPIEPVIIYCSGLISPPLNGDAGHAARSRGRRPRLSKATIRSSVGEALIQKPMGDSVLRNRTREKNNVRLGDDLRGSGLQYDAQTGIFFRDV
ncbi:hypothetical protein ACLMJK_001224 [Lecanora helva]